jgi:sulfur relay (sulfurtransferase) DsrF/TusC family protein
MPMAQGFRAILPTFSLFLLTNLSMIREAVFMVLKPQKNRRVTRP